MDTIEILRARRTVNLATGPVAIQELSWIELKGLLNQIAGQLQGCIGADGRFALDIARLGDLIKNSQELSELLLNKTTGKNFEELGALSVGEFLGLVDAALDLNLAVLADGVKKVGGRLAVLTGGPTAPKTTPPSSASSIF